MTLRREQGLLIGVVLVALWIWSGASQEEPSTRVSAEARPYEPAPLPPDPLAPVVAEPEVAMRDAFREPTESSPLPPVPLPFPELDPLPVVAVPLDPGQQPPAYWQLRVPGGVVEPVTFDAGGEAVGDEEGGDAPGAGTAPAVVANGGGQGPAAGQPYDRIYTSRQTEPLYGFIKQPDKFALVGKPAGAFTQDVVFDFVDRKSGRVIVPNDVVAADEIQRVELATTLQNRIELARRALGSGVASLPDRRALIADLLREARTEPWVYAVAEDEAAAYAKIASDPESRWRPMVDVLRARGDLAAEWELYRGLQDELGGTAFWLTGRGELEARLGLDRDAEEHLRQAARDNPHAPLSAVALARFLLARGRAQEALPLVLGAHRQRHAVDDDGLFEVAAARIEVHLALGDAKAARHVLADLPTAPRYAARRELLYGAVEYADGNDDAALPRFAAAVAASPLGDAALGRAAAWLRRQRWKEAEAAFRQVAERYPLQRHRGLAGLGLLYERTGHADLALDTLEAAAQADPRDPYVLYVLGRMRRLRGQLESSIEALGAALGESDDFVEAHAELARAWLELADRGGEDGTFALDRARRYADRLVELDAGRGDDVAYRELQGLIHFRAGHYRGAREAFAVGEERSLPCRIGRALVEYAQNRVGEARGQLQRLREQLPAGDPTRSYIEGTLALIEDHAEKEQLVDAFERDHLGQHWEQTQANGQVRPVPQQGELRFSGRIADTNRPAFAKRLQPTAGRFLRAGIDLRLGANDESDYAVLELRAGSGRGGEADFVVRLGFKSRQPYLLIHDGSIEQASTDEEKRLWDPVDLSEYLGDVDPRQRQRLVLEVVPGEGDRFLLLPQWNGVPLPPRPLERLGASSRGPMEVGLVVSGAKGAQIDAAFDDFRLVRRQEAP